MLMRVSIKNKLNECFSSRLVISFVTRVNQYNEKVDLEKNRAVNSSGTSATSAGRSIWVGLKFE